MKVLLSLLLLLFQEGPEERSIEVPLPVAHAERPAILLRTPDELPRAAPDAWKRFADPAERTALLTELGPELAERQTTAEREYLRERYPTALETLYAELEDQPDFPPGLMLLGTTYFRLRRYQDCVIALERLLEVAPQEIWRTQALGHSYYSLGDYARARSHYERVLATQPAELGTSTEALRGLALCHMREGDSETALKLLDQVLELNPDHPEAYTFRARILYADDRLDEALAAAERARKVAPYDPQPWYFSMRILYDLGREEEALSAETRWKELDRVAQEVRALENQLRFYPGSYPVLLRLCELAASIGDVQTTRGRLADMLQARPAEVPEVSLRVLALDVLESLDDSEGARVAALALEQTCAGELAAWQRLERFYATTRDRVNQVRCAGEVARLSKGG